MNRIKELLDEAKTATGTETKYALAKALEIHSGLVSHYYSGKRTPDEYACLQIAKATGRTYEEVSAIVRIEAEKDETRRAAWRDYLKSIGGYAASIFLSCIIALASVTFIVTSEAKAAPNQELGSVDAQIIQIMRL